MKQQVPDLQLQTAEIQTQACLSESTGKLCELLVIFIHEPMQA